MGALIVVGGWMAGGEGVSVYEGGFLGEFVAWFVDFMVEFSWGGGVKGFMVEWLVWRVKRLAGGDWKTLKPEAIRNPRE